MNDFTRLRKIKLLTKYGEKLDFEVKVKEERVRYQMDVRGKCGSIDNRLTSIFPFKDEYYALNGTDTLEDVAQMYVLECWTALGKHLLKEK